MEIHKAFGFPLFANELQPAACECTLALAMPDPNQQTISLRFTYVDELISVREKLHGGYQGAPRVVGADGTREGASLNRSCIVMLSAQLQTYVQDVFAACCKQALPSLKAEPSWDAYWRQMKGWGNPSSDNTKNLFLKIRHSGCV